MHQIQALLFRCALALCVLQTPGWVVANDDHDIIGDRAQTLPLFDAHMHYNRSAWSPFPPDVVLSMMDNNGVAMALVSSSPDEGTITLWQYAPKRIVPEMRPYNDQLGPHNWTGGEDVWEMIEAFK